MAGAAVEPLLVLDIAAALQRDAVRRKAAEQATEQAAAGVATAGRATGRAASVAAQETAEQATVTTAEQTTTGGFSRRRVRAFVVLGDFVDQVTEAGDADA